MFYFLLVFYVMLNTFLNFAFPNDKKKKIKALGTRIGSPCLLWGTGKFPRDNEAATALSALLATDRTFSD